jgi:hypothetical protein
MATFRCVYTAKMSDFEASLEWGKQALLAFESLPELFALRDVHRGCMLYDTLARQVGSHHELLVPLRKQLLCTAEVQKYCNCQ